MVRFLWRPAWATRPELSFRITEKGGVEFKELPSWLTPPWPPKPPNPSKPPRLPHCAALCRTSQRRVRCSPEPPKPSKLPKPSWIGDPLRGCNGRGGYSTLPWEVQCLSAMVPWHPDSHASSTSPSVLRDDQNQRNNCVTVPSRPKLLQKTLYKKNF